MTLTKIKWRGVGLSDIGCYRETNQDSFFVDNRNGIYIVADGMGGVAGGEVASKMVIHELPPLLKAAYKRYKGLSDIIFHAKVQEIVQAVNDLIYRAGSEQNLQGMGSTLVLAYIKDHQALLANVGDSRGYLLRDNKLICVTRDHTSAPGSSELTRAMGSLETTQADIHLLDLSKNDRVLLCSDGLSHMISDDKIQEVIDASKASTVCKNLVKAANVAGGEDNITVVSVNKR